jgi:hypothetical protein
MGAKPSSSRTPPRRYLIKLQPAMSQSENPDLLRPGHEVTLEDVRALMGASTPHFAMQLRTRIRALIKDLPTGHPARIAGEREIARLDEIAYDGEIRGHAPEDGMTPLASVTANDATLHPEEAEA